MTLASTTNTPISRRNWQMESSGNSRVSPNAWKVTMHKIEAPRVNDVTPDDPYYYLYACAKNEL